MPAGAKLAIAVGVRVTDAWNDGLSPPGVSDDTGDAGVDATGELTGALGVAGNGAVIGGASGALTDATGAEAGGTGTGAGGIGTGVAGIGVAS